MDAPTRMGQAAPQRKGGRATNVDAARAHLQHGAQADRRVELHGAAQDLPAAARRHGDCRAQSQRAGVHLHETSQGDVGRS